jgi:hypothetical protein
MMERLNRRMPHAAMLVAIVALIAAVGGGAYAAKVALKKNTVTTKSIKKAAVTTPKIANKAVTSGKLADKAVTSGKLADGAVTSAKLGTCRTGTILFAGNCYETTARAADNLYDASRTCGTAGGRVPLAGELLAIASQPGIDLGSNGASTGNWAAELVHNDASTIDDSGADSVNLNANTTDRPYRCVFPRG